MPTPGPSAALTGVSVLIRLWEVSGRRLRDRCRGMGDEEFFWEPVADCWNIRPDASQVGGWSYEYEFAPAEPAPVTTIGWRLVHVSAGNRVSWDHAFGDGTLAFTDLEVPHTATDALQAWTESRRPITAWLADATDEDLSEVRPCHVDARGKAAGEQIRTLVDEQVHHAAEIALLRDLYLRHRA